MAFRSYNTFKIFKKKHIVWHGICDYSYCITLMHNPRIHIICRKPEIAGLITKALEKSGYSVSSTFGEEISQEMIVKIDANIECLIFDKDIDDSIKKSAKEKFKGAKVICLPSLESPNSMLSDVEYMSEPFRLSELTEFVNNLFHLRIK